MTNDSEKSAHDIWWNLKLVFHVFFFRFYPNGVKPSSLQYKPIPQIPKFGVHGYNISKKEKKNANGVTCKDGIQVIPCYVTGPILSDTYIFTILFKLIVVLSGNNWWNIIFI